LADDLAFQTGCVTVYKIIGYAVQRVFPPCQADIVLEDVCQPLGISDLYFGVSEELGQRIAIVGGQRVPWFFFPPFLLIKRVMPTALEPGPIWNSDILRRAVIPAGNMITSARSLARHYAALCGTGVDGVRLLTPEHVTIATALQTEGPDWVMLGGRIRKALGYWVGGDADTPFGSRASVFGHPGAGGSIGFADPEYRFSFVLLKNALSYRGADDTEYTVVRTIREALGIPS
jgi:CubicO group peptidase (beta-lactamase class C family)